MLLICRFCRASSPTSISALKSFKILLSIRSTSLKRGNFDIRQRKFKNNTDVYLQNFLQYYAQFPFLNRIQFDSPMTKVQFPVFLFYFIFFVFLSVFRRGDAIFPFKRLKEIGFIEKAGLGGNLINGPIGFFKKIYNSFEPYIIYVFFR